MGRESSDPTMVGSSIALLQERFKQLQRMRERREEQELLKVFSGTKQVSPTMSFEPAAGLSLPSQDGLSLRLNSINKPAEYFRAVKTGKLADLWSSTDATIMSTSPFIENSEVDTSLHL